MPDLSPFRNIRVYVHVHIRIDYIRIYARHIPIYVSSDQVLNDSVINDSQCQMRSSRCGGPSGSKSYVRVRMF